MHDVIRVTKYTTLSRREVEKINENYQQFKEEFEER